MRVIARTRQTGRTTELIELCAAAEARGEVSYIVCHTYHEAYRIAQKAQEKGLNIGFPLTFDEFIRHDFAGQNIHNFFIDNAEWLLARFCVPATLAAIAVEYDQYAES